jgi:acetate kinase
MRVLTINCGSSSLKFDLLEVERRRVLAQRIAGGSVERIGGAAVMTFGDEPTGKLEKPVSAANLQEAVEIAFNVLAEHGWLETIEAVGHRVVHGGAHLSEPVLIDEGVLTRIEAAGDLAPLHNEAALVAIHHARGRLGAAIPMVATFDTGFYRELPDVAANYALPRSLTAKHGIRRYGFHGLAHRYMLERFSQLHPAASGQRTVSFQLGNGCSATASVSGKPVDTSMGFTPLEGLIMGTRSGDIDPSLPPFLMQKESLTARAVESVLNGESGLLGLSGRSDMRELLIAAAAGEADASLAVRAFCYRAKKYLGAYAAAMGGVDAVLFGGGIGENSPEVRAGICEGMTWAGIELDAQSNAATIGTEALISRQAVQVWVLPVDESSVIAADVLHCLT